MLLVRSSFLTLGVLAAAIFVSCTDDKQKTNEPVQATNADSPDSSASDPSSYRAETVYFAFDDYSVNTESQDKLNKLASFLKASAGKMVQIEGHCDERGSVEYNLALGERRAQSVKRYLEQLGVDSKRLTTVSYGEEKPVETGHSEEVWSKNRRAEFVVSGN